MVERLASKEIRLKNRNTFVLAFGYTDYDKKIKSRPNEQGFADEAKFMGKLLASTLKTDKSKVLINNECTIPIITSSLEDLNQAASQLDTLFVFYSGHGEPDDLKLPSSQNPNSDGELESFSKKDFFESVGQFPGRKVVIISACHGDFEAIPSNTLLLTPSKRDAIAYGHTLISDLICDCVKAGNTSDPLSAVVSRILTAYHNKPYGPFEGVWSQNPDYMDWKIYEDEKRLGKEILKGYQRANVRSTLFEDMIPLKVDPHCDFIG